MGYAHCNQSGIFAVKVWKNKEHYILEVPAAPGVKKEIANLMAYRGLIFSTAASSRETAVLFGNNPYALADLADATCPELMPYRRMIDLSRALDGKGTQPPAARQRALGLSESHARLSLEAARRDQRRSTGARKNSDEHCLLQRGRSAARACDRAGKRAAAMG
jgi:hypothetical protein